MELEYRVTQKRYRIYLEFAFNQTKKKYEKYLPNKSFNLKPIDFNVLEIWKSTWETHPNSRWNWIEYNHFFKNKTAKYFNLSIWSGNVLCGLAIGKPSRKNKICSLYLLEGAPMPHPLKGHVMPLALDIFENYSILISKGSITLRLIDPFEELIALYEAFGYKTEISYKASRRLGRGEKDYLMNGDRYCVKFF